MLQLTRYEKQFLTGLVEYIYQNNSVNYYETTDWTTENTILTDILTALTNAPQDVKGLNIYDRFGYKHYDLWNVEFTPQTNGWIQSTLSQWMDANGWYGRPYQPGYNPPTTQVEIVRSLMKKLITG